METAQQKLLDRIRENASIGSKRISSLMASKDPEVRQLGRDLKAFFDQIDADADAVSYVR